MKVVGAVLLAFAIPLSILSLIAVLISIRPHAPLPPCKERKTVEVTLFEGSYFDLRFPLSYQCAERYR